MPKAVGCRTTGLRPKPYISQGCLCRFLPPPARATVPRKQAQKAEPAEAARCLYGMACAGNHEAIMRQAPRRTILSI